MTKLSLPAVFVCGWIFGAVWGMVFALMAASEGRFVVGVALGLVVAVSCGLAMWRD